MNELEPAGRVEVNLDALEDWANEQATSVTRSFSREARMAEIVLELFASDLIGNPLEVTVQR